MTDTTDSATTYVGRVKWFNNKTGFGFITVMTEGEHYETDVFVHHSAIQVKTEQYKYLVQGEYVHFNLRSSDSTSHPYQAANLTGPYGGQLMCETRNEQRQQRADKQDGEDEQDSRSQRRPPRRRTVRLQGAGPREGETWTLVREDNRRGGRGGVRRRQQNRRQSEQDA